jgi:hypothetical protein
VITRHDKKKPATVITDGDAKVGPLAILRSLKKQYGQLNFKQRLENKRREVTL